MEEEERTEALSTARRMLRPVVAIVGRPNVGKSTLFNRIAGKRLALVEDLPGVTRDRHYADAEWLGRPFTLVDTGGFLPETQDPLLRQVRDQARLAIIEARAIVFVVDGMDGCTATDLEVASLLRKANKPVLLAVNKLDSHRRESAHLPDFYRLGIERTFPVSAEHGRGIGDLLDALATCLPAVPMVETEEEDEERACRVAIVGRPNTGKSTLVNRLLGEERLVSSEVPGTTRDSIDTRLVHNGRPYVLTDTAGIRRKRSIDSTLERYSVVRAFAAIDRSDVVLLLLDAREPAVEQDARIAALAAERGKGVVVLVNKWDLMRKGAARTDEYREELSRRLPFLAYAPVLFVSALTGESVERAVTITGELFEELKTRVPTPLVNKLLQKVVDQHPAPLADGRPVRIFYIAQVGVAPPTFALSCNRPEGVTEDYQRFIANRMRDAFGLRVPIRLLLRKKTKRAFVPRPEAGGSRRPKTRRRRRAD
jgi:GTP-binding protein